MPRVPKGEKRPADVIGVAIMVGRIATGDIDDAKAEKNPHAAALGKLGVRGAAMGSRDARRHGKSTTDACDLPRHDGPGSAQSA
jgi:hypothetical protein